MSQNYFSNTFIIPFHKLIFPWLEKTHKLSTFLGARTMYQLPLVVQSYQTSLSVAVKKVL